MNRLDTVDLEPKDLFAILINLTNKHYITQTELRNIKEYILYGDQTLE